MVLLAYVQTAAHEQSDGRSHGTRCGAARHTACASKLHANMWEWATGLARLFSRQARLTLSGLGRLSVVG